MFKVTENFYMKRKLIYLFILLMTACSSSTPQPQTNEFQLPATQTSMPPSATATQTIPANTATPQPLPSPGTYGPDQFPQGYNPLSGEPVSDPARLEYPAILLSVSHFPPEARPQAGLSFTPWVYEYYITEGSTRHLAVVY